MSRLSDIASIYQESIRNKRLERESDLDRSLKLIQHLDDVELKKQQLEIEKADTESQIDYRQSEINKNVESSAINKISALENIIKMEIDSKDQVWVDGSLDVQKSVENYDRSQSIVELGKYHSSETIIPYDVLNSDYAGIDLTPDYLSPNDLDEARDYYVDGRVGLNGENVPAIKDMTRDEFNNMSDNVRNDLKSKGFYDDDYNVFRRDFRRRWNLWEKGFAENQNKITPESITKEQKSMWESINQQMIFEQSFPDYDKVKQDLLNADNVLYNTVITPNEDGTLSYTYYDIEKDKVLDTTDINSIPESFTKEAIFEIAQNNDMLEWYNLPVEGDDKTMGEMLKDENPSLHNAVIRNLSKHKEVDDMKDSYIEQMGPLFENIDSDVEANTKLRQWTHINQTLKPLLANGDWSSLEENQIFLEELYGKDYVQAIVVNLYKELNP